MATSDTQSFDYWLNGEPVVNPKISAVTDPIDFFQDGEPYEVLMPSGDTVVTYRYFFGF